MWVYWRPKSWEHGCKETHEQETQEVHSRIIDIGKRSNIHVLFVKKQLWET